MLGSEEKLGVESCVIQKVDGRLECILRACIGSGESFWWADTFQDIVTNIDSKPSVWARVRSSEASAGLGACPLRLLFGARCGRAGLCESAISCCLDALHSPFSSSRLLAAGDPFAFRFFHYIEKRH